MDDPKKMSLTEIKMALESVERAIKSDIDFLDDAKDYFVEDDELWTIYNLRRIKVREMVDEKTGNLIHTERGIENIKKVIDRLNKLKSRRNDLVMAMKRKEYGDEYFKEKENKPINKVIEAEAMSLIDLIKKLKSQSVYTYVLLDSVNYNDERTDDKYFIVWCRIIGKPLLASAGLQADTEKTLTCSSYGYPLSGKEIGIELPVVKTKPKKEFMNVNNRIIIEAETDIEIRKIREQLTNNNFSGIITLDDIKYAIAIEKSENIANYYLYEPEEYNNYIDALKNPLLDICKTRNDEEFIDLFIELNKWQRKGNSKEHQIQINYLEEIKGIFDIWYHENGFDAPNLYDKISSLREEGNQLKEKIRQLIIEIKSIQSKIDILESGFAEDITKFPKDLKKQIEEKENEIMEKQNLIDQTKIKFWGTLCGAEGIYWKYNRYMNEYKKIKLGDEKYKELSEKSTDKQVKNIEQEIREAISVYNEKASDIEVTDLCLETLEYLSEDEIEFGVKEIDLATAIREVLKRKYKVDEANHTEIETEKKYISISNSNIEIDNLVGFLMQEAIINNKQALIDKPQNIHKKLCHAEVQHQLNKLLTKDSLTNESKLTQEEFSKLNKQIDGSYDKEYEDYFYEGHKSEVNELSDGLPHIPNRKIKIITKEHCEKLITEGKIVFGMKETKQNKDISKIIISCLKYTLTEKNKRTISDYFRKGELLLQIKNGTVIVRDTYPRKKQKGR